MDFIVRVPCPLAWGGAQGEASRSLAGWRAGVGWGASWILRLQPVTRLKGLLTRPARVKLAVSW